MQRLLARCQLIYTKEHQQKISEVLDFATKKHEGQRRVSGEPYITHPIAVANILLDLGMDYSSVCAALLHDVLEDTDTTEEELRERFGDTITELVLGVTKLKKITFTSKEQEQAENFRRMFFAMAKDIRVLIIKLADRLHNMRTVEALSRERQVALANETLEIYARLASRLGLSYMKCEMEDICLKVLHPDAYEALVKEVSLKRQERRDIVDKLCATLRDMMKEHGIVGEVSGRPKHFYSIYKKMTEKHKTFEQIYDLTAVRIIVGTVEACYEVLGLIHSRWKPIPGRFKDYIAVPKPNNYQSLHTTVMTNYGTPFEIQIRTYEMHRIAEYGIAAHWKYKEHVSNTVDDAGDDKLKWLRGVMDAQGEAADPQELYESLKVDLYEGQVFIFTPKGDVVILPEGSTPIDFAYSVHSEIGNHCVGAKINNRIVPLETKLATGDYVEIITANSSKGPSRDWLRVVKTTQARTKIRAWFKKEMKEENIRKGKDMLEEEAKRLGYSFASLLRPEWLNVVMRRYSFTSMDDLYASIGYGGYTVHQILPKLIDFYRKEQKAAQPFKNVVGKRRDAGAILVNGEPDMLCHVAKCCNPVPGDRIVGYISNGRGVTVHRAECPNIKYVDKRKLIDASWGTDTDTSGTFVVSLQIVATDSADLIVQISMTISELKLSIHSINGRVDKNGMAVLTIGVNVNNIKEIDTLISKLRLLPRVAKVFRSTST